MLVYSRCRPLTDLHTDLHRDSVLPERSYVGKDTKSDTALGRISHIDQISLDNNVAGGAGKGVSGLLTHSQRVISRAVSQSVNLPGIVAENRALNAALRVFSPGTSSVLAQY